MTSTPSWAGILAATVSNALDLITATMPLLMGLAFIDDARRSAGSQQS